MYMPRRIYLDDFARAVGQKSFYGRAVAYCYEHHAVLKSYDTIVAAITDDGEFHRLWGGYSRTTMNHVNAFRDVFRMEKLYKRDWDDMDVEPVRNYY